MSITNHSSADRFAIAPMMDWTDLFCRAFHRTLSKHALLYTEMVVADAILHGDRDRFLAFDHMTLPRSQHPIALQLGGSEPDKLARAVEIADAYGYDEINLNVGCPSDRVQSGTFGACLMRDPRLVGQCVAAMKSATKTSITVKCRLGVDDQDTEQALDALADACTSAGVDALWVHARKAWLEGLSPKENRDIPPLDYDRVYRLKERLPDLFVGINGGIGSLEDAARHLGFVDGVMLGRAAYHDPALLLDVDERFFGSAEQSLSRHEAVRALYPMIEEHIASGGKLMHVTRHILGLFHGQPGARKFRQVLSTRAHKTGAGPEVVEEALRAVPEHHLAPSSSGNQAAE
jgi:tRNA-dihydrouridine synthase A